MQSPQDPSAASCDTSHPAVGQREDTRLSRRRLLRRGCLLAGVVPVAAATDGLLITPRRLTTSSLVFGSGDERLRILQVSDLHVHGIGTLEQQLLEQIHHARADLIVFTGDSIDNAAALAHLDALLAELPRTPRMLAIYGNWEYHCGLDTPTLARTYERHGVELLVNRSVEIEHHRANRHAPRP
jgi:predicted MPP superfamily phosphohydrolase